MSHKVLGLDGNQFQVVLDGQIQLALLVVQQGQVVMGAEKIRVNRQGPLEILHSADRVAFLIVDQSQIIIAFKIPGIQADGDFKLFLGFVKPTLILVFPAKVAVGQGAVGHGPDGFGPQHKIVLPVRVACHGDSRINEGNAHQRDQGSRGGRAGTGNPFAGQPVDGRRHHQAKPDDGNVKVALGNGIVDFDQVGHRHQGDEKPPDAERNRL